MIEGKEKDKISPMENLPAVVGKNLQTLRKAKGMTQQDLARQINYSDKSISKWELGYALPSVDILLDFASFYGVTLDFLVSEHQEEEVKKTASVQPKDVNRPTIMAMTLAVLILIAIAVFFSRYFFTDESIDKNGLWPVFLWMIPIGLFLMAAETHLFYHNSLGTLILASCALWALLIVIPLGTQRDDLWLLMVAGVPIEIIMILWRNLKKRRD